VFDLLQARKYEEFGAQFSPNLRALKFPEMTAKAWAQDTAKLGPFTRSSVLRAAPADEGHIKYRVYLECEFGQTGKRYALVRFDSAKRICGLMISARPIAL